MNRNSLPATGAWSGDVIISAGRVSLAGQLHVPANAAGLVLFAHGSGSSRLSRRNRSVAAVLQRTGIATLLFDLLTPEEEEGEAATAHLRFNIEFLAFRLSLATEWARADERIAALRRGYFGASTGAAAALLAAANPASEVAAIVSRGGRPDLAVDALDRVRAPTLLIVGGADEAVLELNERACRRLRGEKRLEIVPGATHLFAEPGALERVAELAARWFLRHLRG